jgi:DNA modification methylase
MKLINWECLEEMDKLIEQWIKVDAIITDPPYEISNSRGGMMERDNRNFIKQIDWMDMTKWFDINNFLNKTMKMFNHKQDYLWVYFCSNKQLNKYLEFAISNKYQYWVLVWHKTNPAPLCNNKYLNDIEFIVYIKWKNSRILWNYYTKSLVYTSTVNKKDKKEFWHPTIKPVELMEKFIINHSNENQTILDPFMWSWTTWVACKNLNRDFIWIELDENYFNIAKERINNNETKHMS